MIDERKAKWADRAAWDQAWRAREALGERAVELSAYAAVCGTSAEWERAVSAASRVHKACLDYDLDLAEVIDSLAARTERHLLRAAEWTAALAEINAREQAAEEWESALVHADDAAKEEWTP